MSRVLPILFNTEMVRAILDGRKTVTRRLVKPQPQGYFEVNEEPLYIYDTDFQQGRICPQYQPGDVLYVRETWTKDNHRYMYRADYSDSEKFYQGGKEVQLKWHPSLHMPKEAARIFLKVKDVRVERLWDITEEQTEDEGFQFTPPCLSRVSEDSYCDLDGPCTSPVKYCDMSAGELFGKVLWNSTIKKSDLARYGWDANPWVWVIEFERCEKPEEDKNERDSV